MKKTEQQDILSLVSELTDGMPLTGMVIWSELNEDGDEALAWQISDAHPYKVLGMLEWVIERMRQRFFDTSPEYDDDEDE